MRLQENFGSLHLLISGNKNKNKQLKKIEENPVPNMILVFQGAVCHQIWNIFQCLNAPQNRLQRGRAAVADHQRGGASRRTAWRILRIPYHALDTKQQ